MIWTEHQLFLLSIRKDEIRCRVSFVPQPPMGKIWNVHTIIYTSDTSWSTTKFFQVALAERVRRKRGSNCWSSLVKTKVLLSVSECQQAKSISMMEYPSRSDSRAERLMTVQELLLEYSLVVIVTGCFLLVSLSLKLFRDNCSYKHGISWVQ